MAGQGVEKLRAQYRECYHLKAATRRAVGLCAKCGSPAFSGLTYCSPCTDNHNARRPLELKNAQSRRRARPKAAGFFTDCGAPARGAERCAPCAERLYHHSDIFKGIPVWDPTCSVANLVVPRRGKSISAACYRPPDIIVYNYIYNISPVRMGAQLFHW